LTRTGALDRGEYLGEHRPGEPLVAENEMLIRIGHVEHPAAATEHQVVGAGNVGAHETGQAWATAGGADDPDAGGLHPGENVVRVGAHGVVAAHQSAIEVGGDQFRKTWTNHVALLPGSGGATVARFRNRATYSNRTRTKLLARLSSAA
jgi:hypothetical protein